MTLSTSRKVEKAVKLWLESSLGISGMNYYEGHEKADEIETPHLVIYAENSANHPDFPQECGVRQVSLRCKFTVDSIEISRTNLDSWKDALILKMTDDRDAMQTALNKPASGTDSRAVKKIHFHDIELTEEPSDTVETDWIEDCVFQVTCEPLDA